jgi:hypothetical protein
MWSKGVCVINMEIELKRRPGGHIHDIELEAVESARKWLERDWDIYRTCRDVLRSEDRRKRSETKPKRVKSK